MEATRQESSDDEQRQWLLKANQQVLAGQSLIPTERTYKQHLSHYQVQTKHMGLSKCHGLRHAYAQRRYHELTRQLDPQNIGWLCPIAGGRSSQSLNANERAIDRQAREIISRELGHSRLAITRIYLF